MESKPLVWHKPQVGIAAGERGDRDLSFQLPEVCAQAVVQPLPNARWRSASGR